MIVEVISSHSLAFRDNKNNITTIENISSAVGPSCPMEFNETHWLFRFTESLSVAVDIVSSLATEHETLLLHEYIKM